MVKKVRADTARKTWASRAERTIHLWNRGSFVGRFCETPFVIGLRCASAANRAQPRRGQRPRPTDEEALIARKRPLAPKLSTALDKIRVWRRLVIKRP